MKLENPKTGEVIESTFDTHKEAATRLIERITAGEFKNTEFEWDLVAVVAKFGEEISAPRAFWLHKKAMGRQAPVASGTFNLTGLKTLFANAATHLKRPAIVLALPTGDEVRVSLAGPASRYAGQIMVSSPEYGGAYYGRVADDGSFFDGRDSSESVKSLLLDLSVDAAACAARHGHLTGKCCFCNKSLTDEKSTAVGYGSTCAKKFHLPWGARAAAAASNALRQDQGQLAL